MKLKKAPIADIAFYAILSAVYLSLLYMAARNLSYSFLWFDESGQFFISQGLNHDSLPYSNRGNILDVINSNAHYNMDPGGYGILLYLWSGISTNIIWLRLLSFLFMCSAILLSIVTTLKIYKSPKIATISGLLVFSLFGGAQFYELRAYGMELCGVIAGLWAAIWCYNSLSLRKIIITTLILAFFATSRYTMLVFSWLYVFLIIVLIFINKEKSNNKILYSIILVTGLLLITSYIYFQAMSIQNGGLSSLFYVSYFPGKRDLLLLLILVIFTLITFRLQNERAKLVIFFFWISSVCFAILGCLSLLPWNFWGNKGGPFLWLAEFTAFISFISLLRHLIKSSIFTNWICLSGTVIFVLFIVYKIGGPGLRHQFDVNYQNIESALQDRVDTIYVNRFGCPETRFYFEYGKLKDKAQELGYPERFKFLNGIPHNFNRPRVLEIERDFRKKEFFENMPINSILLGNYKENEDSLYKDDFQLIAPYVNIKIK